MKLRMRPHLLQQLILVSLQQKDFRYFHTKLQALQHQYLPYLPIYAHSCLHMQIVLPENIECRMILQMLS